MDRGFILRYDPDIFWQLRDPIVRDSRLAVHDSSLSIKSLTILTHKIRSYPENSYRIVDREGVYTAVARETR